VRRTRDADHEAFDPTKAAYRGGWSRTALARHLEGEGIEIGPGHQPWPLPYEGASLKLVDKWTADECRALFPELGEAAVFPEPDVICDLDADGLAPFDDASVDFVIASQIFEHVANPLRLLDDIHRVLRPGGVVLLLLPDRRRTFDQARSATDVEHVVAEYQAGVTEVDDAHITEFMEHTGPLTGTFAGLSREEEIELHRKRSIHVHAWHEEDFLAVLVHAIGDMGHAWEVVDAVLADEDAVEVDPRHVFGFVMRKSTVTLPPEVRARRFEHVYWTWFHEWHAAHRIRGEYLMKPLRRFGRRVRRRLPGLR